MGVWLRPETWERVKKRLRLPIDDEYLTYGHHHDKQYAEEASNSELWTWLKNPEYNASFSIDVLNLRKSFPFKMKAYICRHRPDLIGKIERLPRRLRRKYKAELELSKVDL